LAISIFSFITDVCLHKICRDIATLLKKQRKTVRPAILPDRADKWTNTTGKCIYFGEENMKKQKKQVTLILAVAMIAAALLYGCGNKPSSGKREVPLNTYTAESGMYEVSLPGDWTQEDNMGLTDMLCLSRSDGAAAVFIGMSKNQLAGAGDLDVESLDDFLDYANSMFLNGTAATTTLTDAKAVEIDGFLNSLAKEGTMTQTEGGSGKVFLQCSDTENAYYVIVLSATDNYDDIVPPVMESLELKELELQEQNALSDTLRWFNTSYALITTLNGGDLDQVAGYEPGELMESTISAMLDRDWGITDKDTLEDTIDWLVSEGHNKDALDYISESGADGMSEDELAAFMDENAISPKDRVVLLSAYNAKKAYGKKAIAGWDLGRAMSLAGWGYLAGHYTYDEAMEKSLKTAKKIQKKFDSWEDFMNSYFLGYSYWSGEDPEDSSSQAYQRHETYETLKDSGVYDVDWNLALEKEW